MSEPEWDVAGLRREIEALPVHKISGYEWECYEPDTGCHYHFAGSPLTCGHEFTGEGNYDRNGALCDHQSLLDRAAVLNRLAASPAPDPGEGLREAAAALVDEWDAAMAGDMPLSGHYQKQALDRLRAALADAPTLDYESLNNGVQSEVAAMLFGLVDDEVFDRVMSALAAVRLAVAEAGHRTKEPHDCFLMNCRDLGDEVESLRERLIERPTASLPVKTGAT